MSNLIDYMDWRGDVALYPGSFNEVDNIILSMITFVDFEGIVSGDFSAPTVPFGEAMEKFALVEDEREYLGVLIPQQLLGIAHRAVKCARYKDIKLAGFVNTVDAQKRTQFSALTFILPDGSLFVAYRGTDDTIAGWQENIMLGFCPHVPAQKKAVEYIENAARTFPGKIRVGGHSKGGNLAMYAAAFCAEDVKKCIDTVYNNDGPGFLPEIVGSDEYKSVADRIITFIPQSSLVGVLLEQSPKYQIIKSKQAGIFQHDPLSWEVMGAGFVCLDKRSRYGEKSEEGVKKWIDSMSEEQRKKISEILFSVIDSTGAKTLTELSESKIRNLNIILKSFHSLDKKTRNMVTKTMMSFIEGRPANIQDTEKEKISVEINPIEIKPLVEVKLNIPSGHSKSAEEDKNNKIDI